ncbi:MAG: OmpA family protein [Candidatus Zixiibacteriota bacterium]|nr:MAG: OmpA family protein [candidate division Zixibacteria bacterium]
MAEKAEQPIIIRKKRGGHKGHHSGAWKVAFADFMTAMMAFFLVMWLVGQKDEVKQAVAGYFRDPGKYNTEGKSGVLRGSANIIEAEGPSNGILDDDKKAGSGPSEQEKKALTLVAKTILHELTQQEAFQRLRKNVKIQLTSEGLRIILNESEKSAAFFEPGSSKLLQQSAIILITIAKELGKLQNRLVIEGHTDAAYGGDNGYSNWELSADRANAARSLMEVSGLWDGQVREVRGFADEFPMIQKDPYDRRNRRVTIVVLYESRGSQYDQIEVGANLMDELSG